MEIIAFCLIVYGIYVFAEFLADLFAVIVSFIFRLIIIIVTPFGQLLADLISVFTDRLNNNKNAKQ